MSSDIEVYMYLDVYAIVTIQLSMWRGWDENVNISRLTNLESGSFIL